MSDTHNPKEALVASKAKQMSKAQAETAVKKNATEYRLYVQAQIEKKDAKTDKARKAAERKMDAHRKGYTAYRNAYRAFKAHGGTLRKPAAAKPAKGTSAKKRNSGKGKGSRKVTTHKLGKAAMARRTKENPLGLTDAQLKAEAEGAPLAQPLGEVISSS